jgi:hypothetical protein
VGGVRGGVVGEGVAADEAHAAEPVEDGGGIEGGSGGGMGLSGRWRAKRWCRPGPRGGSCGGGIRIRARTRRRDVPRRSGLRLRHASRAPAARAPGEDEDAVERLERQRCGAAEGPESDAAVEEGLGAVLCVVTEDH